MAISTLRINEKLPEFLKEKYPNREKNEVLDLVSLAKGWETELFAFLYKYQEGEQKHQENIILRIYPGPQSQSKIEKEFNVLRALHKFGYPVPKTFILELDTKFIGKPFILMERISGSDMGDEFFRIVQEDNGERLQENILPTMNKLFVKLHNLDWQKFQSIEGLNWQIKAEDYWIEQLRKIEHRIQEDKLPELVPIVEWLKKNGSKIKTNLAVTHGDFHPHNIMISDEGKAYVIDWPACTVGDYREDLGWTLMLTGAYTSKEVRDLVLNSYESLKGTEVEFIQYFEVVSALRRFRDIMRMFKKGTESAGMREEAKQQIIDSVYHLEYIIALVKEITGLKISQVEEFIQSVL